MNSEVLPILSLSDRLSSNEGRKELADEFRKAAQSSGFMAIVNHDIQSNLIKETFDAAKRLFGLPMEEKLACERDPNTNKGYEIIGKQSLYGQAGGGHDDKFSEHHGITDLKEGWMFGSNKYSEASIYYQRYLHGPNILPKEEHCPKLADIVAKYYEAVLALASSFLRVVALSLDQEEDFFDQFLVEPISSVRLLHYPPQEHVSLEQIQIGAGPHTDFGLTTWLAIPPNSPGLQVWHQEKWHQVSPPENSYIVNVGDLLSSLSGTYGYKSSLHRVINSSPIDRYSIPFFLEGSLDAEIKPVGGYVNGTPPQTVEGFLRKRYEYTYIADP